MSGLSKKSVWTTETLNEFCMTMSLTKGPSTIQSYSYDINKFFDWLSQSEVKRASSLRTRHIESYLGHCKMIGKSEATIVRYFMSLKSFCKFLKKRTYVKIDLMEDIPSPRITKKAINVPQSEDVAKILAQPAGDTETGCRDKAMLTLLYSSGLRASELCDLRLEDFHGDSVIIRCGKGSKVRTVPITQECRDSIVAYIELYRGDGFGWLFLTQLGRKIRREFLCRTVKAYAEKAGVRNISTHTMRHACATHLLENGADLRLIQEVLGHASISSTQRYTHYSSARTKEMFMKCHPRGTYAV